MTATQVAINHNAVTAAAERLTATGWDGDAYRFVESLLLNAIADGYRRIEAVPGPVGPGASRAAIDEAKQAAAEAVQRAKESRKRAGQAPLSEGAELFHSAMFQQGIARSLEQPAEVES